ncbi:MAG: TIGR04086 family membrane protein [Oscillospiraceae bacterium]
MKAAKANVSKKNSSDLTYKKVIRASAIGMIIVLSFTLLTALLFVKFDIPFEALNPIGSFIFVVSSLTAGYIIGNDMKQNGIIYGSICGGIIFIFSLLISAIVNFSISRIFLIKLIICLISGAIGGMLGVNKKQKGKIKKQ